jgi:hypothetical protein
MTALPNLGFAQREGEHSSLDIARDRSLAEILRISKVLRLSQRRGGQDPTSLR